MKKLRLDLKDLRIDSFTPKANTGTRRDVFAQGTHCTTGSTGEWTCDNTNPSNGYTCTICTTACDAVC